jgi:hypothetical protein
MVACVDAAAAFGLHDPRADPLALVAHFHDLDHYWRQLEQADAQLARQVCGARPTSKVDRIVFK